jgi:hypothetical protein
MRLETSEFIGSIYSYIITTAIFLINNYEKIKDGTLNRLEKTEFISLIITTIMFLLYYIFKKLKHNMLMRIFGYIFVMQLFIFYSLLLCASIQNKWEMYEKMDINDINKTNNINIVSSKEEVNCEKKIIVEQKPKEEEVKTNTETIIEENKPVEETIESKEGVEEKKKINEKPEVIVESTLLDETKEKMTKHEQNNTQTDADMTVDENTIDQKKEAIETTETGLEVKRPTRGSRRSIAPPVAESKTSGRGKKSKKAASIKMKKYKDEEDKVESREAGEENKAESTEVKEKETTEEEKKVESVDNGSIYFVFSILCNIILCIVLFFK